MLKKLEKYVVIGDVALQHDPHIVALVWAGVRFCLQVCARDGASLVVSDVADETSKVAMNDMRTFEGVTSAMDDVAGLLGTCTIYERIYSGKWDSARAVVEQLPRVYAHCLKFMAQAIEYFQTSTASELFSLQWNTRG